MLASTVVQIATVRLWPAFRAGSERDWKKLIMDLNALKYAPSHEWVSLDGDVATIGITNFAVEELTDLVFMELPAVGSQISQGTTFGEVESVKAVSDLYSPVSGEVVEVNEQLPDDLAVLSEDPFGKGWMIKVKLEDPSSVESMMDRAAYEKHCAEAGNE